MKYLREMHLTQFSFWDYESFNFHPGGTAFLGANGAGKTSLVDAIQIALIGAHGQHTHFNAQSIHKDRRSIKDYALGTMRSGQGEGGGVVSARKRDEALSYITLVFGSDRSEDTVSVGVCLHSLISEKSHRTIGLYVLPGVHLSLDDHLQILPDAAKRPLEWGVFDAQARQRAHAAGRSPTITTRPEIYLNELLHALQHKGRTMQVDKFLRALSQSVRLKGITSVNDYLKGYLINAQPIDKQGTLRHIKNVRHLIAQIEDVKTQLLSLSEIDRGFTQLATLRTTRAVAEAVRAQLQAEAADAQVARLSEQVSTLTEKKRQLEGSINSVTEEEAMLRSNYVHLLQAYQADPAIQITEQQKRLGDALRSTLADRQRDVERVALRIRQALADCAELLVTVQHDGAEASAQLAKKWDYEATQGNVPTVDAFRDALSHFQRFLAELHSKRDTWQTEAADRKQALQALLQTIQAADGGMRLRDGGDVGRAMSLFRDAGIGSQTVASLVHVTQQAWQAAIEAFLGRNRFALVVDPGRERQAVQLLRRAQPAIFDVTIVQPEHLRAFVGVSADPASVAALLDSNHGVALAYLRRSLGRLRQVETVEELERFDRALTRDGMLSANGGTRRLRLAESTDLVLGARVSEAEKQRLHTELQEALRAEETARNRVELARTADDSVRLLLRDVNVDTASVMLTRLQVARSEWESQPPSAAEHLPQHIAEAQARVDAARKAAEDQVRKLRDLEGQLGGANSALTASRTQLDAATLEMNRAQAEYQRATSDRDYDSERAVERYTRASALPEDCADFASILTGLRKEAELATNRSVNVETTTRSAFNEFINSRSINLVDERSDWRKAWSWTQSHHRKLKESTLADYEREAEAARRAANETFRADVAYRMREAIKRVQFDINELNKILSACPEFTGGERYRFSAVPSPAYAGIYQLIESSAVSDNVTAPLESASDDTHAQLLGFLEECESGDAKTPNPLEDYRLLFHFDLDILVGGQKVDTLSKRLGVASNGEHLVPFYVIAGASMANAFGLRFGQPHDGTALMILDEAFHGFDAQNTYVTAEFLRSLGLQIILAAPDTDVGKLAPVIDSYYDLDRFGSDVFIAENIVKPAAALLFESDIPQRNPQLVEQRITQLRLVQ